MQHYLASMEGAILSGKLAAEQVAEYAIGRKDAAGNREQHFNVPQMVEATEKASFLM